jgi:hypothetical protein
LLWVRAICNLRSSLFLKHFFRLIQGLIRYCKRDDKQIRDWHADYEDAWGTRVKELVGWKQSTSPSTQHRHSPTSPVQQSPLLQQQISHRRTAEAWSSNSPKSDLRPLSRQHDSSYTRRSPSDGTPALPLLGRSRDDVRNNSSGVHDLSSHSQPPGKAGKVNIDNDAEMERETIARRLVHDSDIDPALKDANGFDVTSNTGGEFENNASVESRDAGGLGDGPQSLPSLKESGLLHWTSRTNGSMLMHSNAPMHPHAGHGTDVRLTSLVSTMPPVGLQWLANESR